MRVFKIQIKLIKEWFFMLNGVMSINKNQCCGCGACESICPKDAITLKADEEGFYYPSIDEEKCVLCNLCKESCGFLNKEVDNNLDIKPP